MGHWNDLHVNTHEFPFRIDPDYDAPWRQPAELLPAWARCDTCLYWCGLCGLDTRWVTNAESRCASWERHPRHAAEVAAAESQWKAESVRKFRVGSRRGKYKRAQ